MREPINAKRLLTYGIGMSVLAIGLTLTKETALGTSPLTAVAAVLAAWLGQSFANMTLAVFTIFAVIEIILERAKTFVNIVLLALQVPVSILFTRIMSIAAAVIDLTGFSVFIRLLFLFLAIFLIGIGAAMTLRSNLIPTPGDGVVKSISAFANKPVGLIKNLFDISNILVAAILSLAAMGRLVDIHIGSILAMLGVGRVIALFNRFVWICRGHGQRN